MYQWNIYHYNIGDKKLFSTSKNNFLNSVFLEIDKTTPQNKWSELISDTNIHLNEYVNGERKIKILFIKLSKHTLDYNLSRSV